MNETTQYFVVPLKNDNQSDVIVDIPASNNDTNMLETYKTQIKTAKKHFEAWQSTEENKYAADDYNPKNTIYDYAKQHPHHVTYNSIENRTVEDEYSVSVLSDEEVSDTESRYEDIAQTFLLPQYGKQAVFTQEPDTKKTALFCEEIVRRLLENI